MKDTNNGLHSYKEYNKEYIGSSDYSSLILVGCENGVKTFALNFGEDSNYYAYIVDNKTHIGSHYMKVAEFTAWMKIYDDDGLIHRFEADVIRVYRAGEMGCIIQLIPNPKEKKPLIEDGYYYIENNVVIKEDGYTDTTEEVGRVIPL